MLSRFRTNPDLGGVEKLTICDPYVEAMLESKIDRPHFDLHEGQQLKANNAQVMHVVTSNGSLSSNLFISSST